MLFRVMENRNLSFTMNSFKKSYQGVHSASYNPYVPSNPLRGLPFQKISPAMLKPHAATVVLIIQSHA